MNKVALLGYGTVGCGIVKMIETNNKKNVTNIDITKILVKDLNKHKHKKYFEIVTEDFDEVIKEECDVIVEIMGGIHPAYEYIKKALTLKKHVITANKDLIAEHGYELLCIAEENNVLLKFEASVGGGIPIIKSVLESLKANEINEIQAIINGTTNFILTQMDKYNLSYKEALKNAQELGFAESNPESDVEGYDSARKLAVVSTLAFKNRIDWKDIHVEGITSLNNSDFEMAKELNCKIKLLAYSKRCENGIYAKVTPVLIGNCSQFFNIDNEVNSVILHCDALGKVSFTGNGAGMLPTASAVINDLIDIIDCKAQSNEKLSTLFKDKINIQKHEDGEWNGVLKIETQHVESVMHILRERLTINKLSVKNNKNIIIVKCFVKKEKVIDDIINELISTLNVKKIRKFLLAT